MQNISFGEGEIVMVFAVVVAVTSFVLLLINRMLSFFVNRHRICSRKNERQFECGLNPTGGSAERLSVSYFMIAAAFLIFELEGAILLPWAVNYKPLGIPGIVVAVIFMTILFLGLIYMLAKGALKL